MIEKTKHGRKIAWWVVYQNPKDGTFAARKFVTTPTDKEAHPTLQAFVGKTLEEVRAQLPAGLVRPQEKPEEPNAIEYWYEGWDEGNKNAAADVTFANIQERTNTLNDMDRSVMESIDRPIRPLVIELSRIGFITKFSCCGYTYDKQEEPKCHGTCPYVLFEVPKTKTVIDNFFRLSSICRGVSWSLSICPNGKEWCIQAPIFEKWENGKDNLAEPIHQYELKLIHIKKLTSALKSFTSVSEKVEIKDGNEQRREVYGNEWMVAPKKSAVYTSKELG